MSHLMSTFAAQSIKMHQSSQKMIGEFKKNSGFGFMSNLPTIEVQGINVNGKFAKTGTIVARTLAKGFFTDLMDEYHYGIVLGTDKNGNEKLIEMTDIRNVNILNKNKFIEPHDESHLAIYKIPNNDFTPEEIYEKAERFEYDIYSILNLNCKDFVQYCIYDQEPKRYGDYLNDFVLKFNEFGQKMNDLYSQSHPDENMRKFFEENNKKLKEDYEIIFKSIKNFPPKN